MAIEIKESFEVAAPIEAVWEFMLSPQNIIACMPGATLGEVLDAQHFTASVKVKIGAVSAQYLGKVAYVEADRATHLLRLLAEGQERGGGTVQARINTRLAALQDSTATQVQCESSVDLTGRIVQVGRGMIEGVAAQIIKRYIENVRAVLEPRAAEAAARAAAGLAPPAGGAAAAGAGTEPPPVLPQKDDSIDAVSIVFRVLWDRLARLFRRLFGLRGPTS